MRKFLLVLGVLVLLFAAGLTVFIITFDADRYRLLLVQQLQKTLGRPVAINHISLGFHNGIAANVEGFSIPDSGGEPLVAVDSASAVIRLMPLFGRKVEIASVLLNHPRVVIVRSAQGQVNLTGLGVASSPATASPAQPSAGSPVTFQVGAVRIIDGTLHWRDALRQPSAEITVNALNVTVKHIAPAQPMDVTLSAAVGGSQPNVKFQGRMLVPDERQAGWIKQAVLDVDKLDIAPFVPAPPARPLSEPGRAAATTGGPGPAAQPGQPRPRGILSTHLQFELPTLDQAELFRMLSAEGDVHLNNFVIENVNILRTVFDKFSMLPGLVQRLEANLPPEYLQKLNARDTAFAPVHVPVKLQSGVLLLDNVDLKTDVIHLTGRGQVAVLTQSLAMQTVLSIDSTLSEAIIRRINELGGLANASGELEVPVAIQGRVPQLAVLPDVNYIASKVIVRKAIDIIGGLLERKSEAASGSEASPNGQTAPSQTAEPTPEELVGGLLRRALKKHLPAEEIAPAQPAQ